MSASFTEIVVSRAAEKAFRRRAIAHMPNEYMEAIWGKFRGDTIHIHAFMPIKHKGKPAQLTYEDHDLEDHEEESMERANLSCLGTVHTHPHCLDAIYSEHDTRDIQDKSDTVMGICSITREISKGKTRMHCEIAYWPAPRPMKIVYTA